MRILVDELRGVGHNSLTGRGVAFPISKFRSMSLHRYQPTTKQPSSHALSGMFACTVHGVENPGFIRDLRVSLASGQEGTY
jgi:hypothetical protein